MADRNLHLETQAAARLKEQLIAAYGEDADAIRDTLEGATNLHEAIAAATLELLSVEGDKEGQEIAIAKLKERLSRHCRKAENIRAAIQVAMETAELTSLKTPAATLSLRPAPPRVEIIEKSLIPAVFMVMAEPQPDKRSIAATIKNGQAVPGAVLSNQPPSLTVRNT